MAAIGRISFFLWLSIIPLCIITTSYLYIRLLMGTWVASISWLLHVTLLWTLTCMYLFKLVFWFFFIYIYIYTGGKLLFTWKFYFYFLMYFHAVIHSGCTNLQAPRQCTWVPFTRHGSQHLLFVYFLTAIQTGMMWYFIMVLICISLTGQLPEKEWG